MSGSLWLWFCALAIVASTAKVFFIKKVSGSISNFHILFYSRLATCAVLIPFYTQVKIPDNPDFWIATIAAVILTTAAGYAYIEALKCGLLAIVSSVQATIPVFMVMIISVVFDELPSWQDIVFIVGAMASLSLVLFFNSRSEDKSGKSAWWGIWLSLIAAVLYAASTVLDRVAIASVEHGAFNYTFIWNAISLVVLWTLMRGRIKVAVATSKERIWLLVVGISSMMAFLAQQYAVQYSLAMATGVTYVKSFVMLHIALLMLLGFVFLGERPDKRVIVASGMGLLFAVGLIVFNHV